MKPFGAGVAFGVFLSWSLACTSLLPMTGQLADMNDAEVARIAGATGLTAAQVRDPVIHEVHEVPVPCSEMLRLCYPSVSLWLKLIGSFPLACTTIWQQPWNEKVAIIHYCWATDQLTLAHEREHARGATHPGW